MAGEHEKKGEKALPDWQPNLYSQLKGKTFAELELIKSELTGIIVTCIILYLTRTHSEMHELNKCFCRDIMLGGAMLVDMPLIG